MNQELRAQLVELKSLSSEDAATWLMKRFPIENQNYGEALALLSHRSWKKADQVRLGDFYLKRIPFASARAYEAFASVMAVSTLVRIVRKYTPSDQRDRELLAYHIAPVLHKHCKTERDEGAVNEFLEALN